MICSCSSCVGLEALGKALRLVFEESVSHNLKINSDLVWRTRGGFMHRTIYCQRCIVGRGAVRGLQNFYTLLVNMVLNESW